MDSEQTNTARSRTPHWLTLRGVELCAVWHCTESDSVHTNIVRSQTNKLNISKNLWFICWFLYFSQNVLLLKMFNTVLKSYFLQTVLLPKAFWWLKKAVWTVSSILLVLIIQLIINISENKNVVVSVYKLHMHWPQRILLLWNLNKLLQ